MQRMGGILGNTHCIHISKKWNESLEKNQSNSIAYRKYEYMLAIECSHVANFLAKKTLQLLTT